MKSRHVVSASKAVSLAARRTAWLLRRDLIRATDIPTDAFSFSDPQRGLKTFTSNPVNSHELVAGGKGMQMMLVNTARGEIVTRVSLTCRPW